MICLLYFDKRLSPCSVCQSMAHENKLALAAAISFSADIVANMDANIEALSGPIDPLEAGTENRQR